MRHAAQKEFFNKAPALGAHDDQGNVQFFGGCQDNADRVPGIIWVWT